jgi:ParB-like chromosome segregation protein Spo0J
MTLVELDSAIAPPELTSEPQLVPLSALPVGHAWRVRGLDDGHVTALAASYGSLPPVVVRRGDRTIVDGAHRVAAARRLGMYAIAVEWFDGDDLQAFEAFVNRNTAHGLELTVEDRKQGVLGVLVAAPFWSDRRVAQLCGVSPKLVARLRFEGTPQHRGSDRDKRIGRDGRARPVRAGAMRGRIAELLEQEPTASLRAVASRLGVSPETVRSVRRQIGGQGNVEHESKVVPSYDELAIERLLFLRRYREVPAPWRNDNAFESTAQGASFVEWFESTTVNDGGSRVDEVPLSRVYDIADEARRRARYWANFADSLEQRTRRRR